VILGFAIGIRFETGLLGVLAFMLIGGIWGLVYTGFPYAIALKTGNPAAVNTSFLLFFPFVFLTTTFLPKEAMTGWMATVATYNPVTYVLDALRSLITVGWDGERLLYGFISIGAIGLLSMTLAFTALSGRVRKR
jgi:ABC-2 type transport system permease protein